MWIVTGPADGERGELITRVVERDEPPSLEQVREAAADLPRAERLIRYVDAELRITRESGRFVRSFDAVQRWSARAEAESRDFATSRDRFVSLPEAGGALGYFFSPADRSPRLPDSVVWHAHSLVVVSVPAGVDQIELEYRPEPRDAVLLESLTARFRTPAHIVETILDARTCRGTDSELVDHFSEMRARGHGSFTSVRGTADVLVGRVLYRVTAVEPAPLEDPTYQPRLTTMRERWPDISRSCPDIGTLSHAHEHDTAMVFIHGTVSCGVQSLKDLFPSAPPPFPVYRYEHDTFLRVAANGKELAGLIATYIKPKRLLLVAHSRGGLVGRVTLSALIKRGFGADTRLLTFGTPHEGTPLVKVAKGLLNLLLRVGSQVIDGIPFMAPVVAAFSHVHNVSSLPDGIAIMQEGSEPLDLLNDALPLPYVRSWGSAFDAHKGESGFGFDIENILTGAMGRGPHDLVVPMSSALACGMPQPALSCSHVRYFAQPAVRDAILNALPSPDPVPPGPRQGIRDSPSHDPVGWIPAPEKASFSYRLSDDSRLPRWFTLPEGTKRSNVSVRLRYARGRASAKMTLDGSGGTLQSVTCEVRPDPNHATPGDYPRREVLETAGMIEVIEYREMGPVFHIIA